MNTPGTRAGFVGQIIGKRMASTRRLSSGYLLLAPFIVLFLVFIVWPILNSLYLSFTDYNGIKPAQFIGLDNYSRLLGLDEHFKDERFKTALINTVAYVAVIVILNSAAGLGLAMAFRAPTLINQICRAMFFLPAVTSTVAVSVLWRIIFTSDSYGLANTVLNALGIKSISFFSRPEWTLPIIVLVTLWGGVGSTMIIFLAGLQSIPHDLTEAAAIDGAKSGQRFLFITLPLLRPTTLYVIITGIIGAFQIFDVVYLLYPAVGNVGGPLDSALFIVPYLYDRGFNRFQLGYASSIAWVLFIIIFIVTLINLRFGREK
ncbi:MAG TPA: sugar ABC transporter permease [Chloroflexia bacterium]|nr:sugar ABC transporter permease [Chloroflexia bacterium]